MILKNVLQVYYINMMQKSLLKGALISRRLLFFFYLAALKIYIWNTAGLFQFRDYRDYLN